MDELRKGQADARGAARTERPGRILIIRPSALGDVCRTVPVLASLRRAYPEASIDWVVRDSFLAGIAAHPALHEAIPFPRRRFARWWRSPAVGCEVYRWFRGLRRRRYDLVFDCQGLGRSGLIAWATGAARRVGFRSAREFAWLGYNVHVPAAAPHTVDAMLSLLEGQGIATVADMRLYVADEDRRWWSRRREELRFGERSYAVLAPTARWPSKRWPIERWRAVAGALPEMGCERTVVIGAPGERDQVAGIEPEAPSARAALVDLVGETSVGQTMAVIASAALVVANDSAPLHMAIGFGRPCVALFGPTDPAQVGPYGRPEAVVRGGGAGPGAGSGGGRINYRRRRLDDALMRGIAVEDVLARIAAIVREPSRSRGGLVASPAEGLPP